MELVAVQNLLADQDLANQMRDQFQGERSKLMQVREDIASSVREYVKEEAEAYEESKAKLVAKLNEARESASIKASMIEYASQADKVQSLADKIMSGVNMIADNLSKADMDEESRDQQLSQLRDRLQDIMLTTDEKNKLQTLTQMLGNVTTTAAYIEHVPSCALRGLALQ